MKIIISGGGTGGHIFPAISIAREVQQRFTDAEILFVGAHNRMEMEKVPAAGYRIIGLPVAGLQRRLTYKNLTFLPKLFISLSKCRAILKSFKPDLAVGVGGYASGPLLRTAQKMGIPTLIQEQNSYAGMTNKMLAAKADKICVAYHGMDKYFPAEKIVFTGNPVRKGFNNVAGHLDEAINFFRLQNDKPTVLVIGGSLGAGSINQAIAANLDELIRKKVQVIWQTGKTYFSKAKDEVRAFNTNLIQVHEFINRMDYAYAAADVIISRAGAGTISELYLVGKPVVLVPSPNVAEDHQTKNAMALVEKSAAVLVKDKETNESLVKTCLDLLDDEVQMVELGKNIKKLAKTNAAGEIVDEIAKLIGEA